MTDSADDQEQNQEQESERIPGMQSLLDSPFLLLFSA